MKVIRTNWPAASAIDNFQPSKTSQRRHPAGPKKCCERGEEEEALEQKIWTTSVQSNVWWLIKVMSYYSSPMASTLVCFMPYRPSWTRSSSNIFRWVQSELNQHLSHLTWISGTRGWCWSYRPRHRYLRHGWIHGVRNHLRQDACIQDHHLARLFI